MWRPAHLIPFLMIKKIYILISCAVLFSAFQCVAQTSVSGVVKTPIGHGVDMASVTVACARAPENILASAFTDEDGRYILNVASDCDYLIVKASSIEIAQTAIVIPNKTGTYHIIAEDRTMELKEVVVKSKKIYTLGDTINYNVASYLSQNDQVLADVLKKMPGIDVSETGEVSYQGKAIKKFYIEGLDHST